MQYNIIATLGPASQSEDTWRNMISLGVTSFRLNTSHMEAEETEVLLKRVSEFCAKENLDIPVVLDLQGSKWRIGTIKPYELKDGEAVELTLSEKSDSRNVLPVPHGDFFKAAQASGKEIVLNDAKVVLNVESVNDHLISARVTKGGPVSSRKGITFSSTGYRSESLKKKDEEIIKNTSKYKNVRYAVSYIKDAEEMKRYRGLIGEGAYIIAKLERAEALRDALKIKDYCNELWLCRGDLGAELGLRKMAEAAADFSNIVKDMPRPVILAGQVLEHMAHHAEPTRSEISCIYEALQKGYAGIVLSDETAVGKYPIDACRTAAMFR
ncbi:MAG TPA: pyruvate kinase [Ignavibacteriales bacterium]|nr:pyruvate kinase [Ignavibacteriales bacterium]